MLIFTRYLYIKDEVELSLLVSIFKKNYEQSIFWANELYYSGFEKELQSLLIKYYFDFFFIENSQYLDDIYVMPFYQIVDLLINLSFCLNVFYIKNNCNYNFEHVTEENQFELFNAALKEKSIEFLYKYLMEYCDELCLPFILNTICKHFNKNLEKKRIVSSLQYLKNRYAYFLFSLSFYQETKERKTISTRTIELDWEETIEPWKRLKDHCIYKIDEWNSIKMFGKLEREKDEYTDLDLIYREKWLYYASFSPLWEKRIKLYNGFINHEKKEVNFLEEEEEEDFYNIFDLEPDEQSLLTREKSIGLILIKIDLKIS